MASYKDIVRSISVAERPATLVMDSADPIVPRMEELRCVSIIIVQLDVAKGAFRDGYVWLSNGSNKPRVWGQGAQTGSACVDLSPSIVCPALSL